MFAVDIVHPQALSAPQRAVLAHADPVQRQGDNVPTAERPAIFSQTRRRMGMMMQHGFNGQRLLQRPLTGVIRRMGIAHDTRGLKGINLLHHCQRRTPLCVDPSSLRSPKCGLNTA